MNRALSVFLVLLVAVLIGVLVGLRSCADPSVAEGVLVSIDPSGVERIRIQTGAESFELKKQGAQWLLKGGGLRDAADPARVAALLAALTSVGYSHHLAAHDVSRDELEQFGIKNDKVKIEIEGRDPASLILGNEAVGQESIFARLAGKNDVFVIRDTLRELVELPPGTYRNPTLTTLPPSQIDGLTVRTRLGVLKLERTPAGWRLIQPLNARADDQMVRRYLVSLLQMPVLDFVSSDSGDLGEYGIREGKEEIEFRPEGSERPLVLRFGDGRGDALLAQFTGRDSVVAVPTEAGGMLEVTPQTFRDRHLLPINIDLLDRIRVSRHGQTTTLEREGNNWIDRAGAGRTISNQAVAALLDTLATTEVTSFSAEPLEDHDVETRLEFLSVLSENTPEMETGEYDVAVAEFTTVSDGARRARVSDQSGTLIVPGDVLSDLPELQGAD